MGIPWAGGVGAGGVAVTPSSQAPMTLTEMHDALQRLDALPTVLGAEVPDALMSFLKGTIHERDAGAARLARFLRETVHVRHVRT